MKRVAVTLIAGMMLFGAACSSDGDKSAEEKYNAFVDKYEPAVKDLKESFGSSTDSFDEYVSGDGCEPIDDASAGMATVFFGPTLAEHGLSVDDFIDELRDVHEAIKSEGLCNSTKTVTKTTEPVVTTTTEPSKENTSECLEARKEFQENSDSDFETFNRLFEAAQKACN